MTPGVKRKKEKLGVVSLGCPRNLVDTENFLGSLRLKGYEITDIDKADIGIINTCSFIEDAKKESIDYILDLIELKREGKLKKIIVCGCLVQRYGKELYKEFPEVDAFIGSPSLDNTQARYPITPRHFAYLKIAEGCVHNCSFCAIPRIKGKLRSLPQDKILKKVLEFNREKLSELNIIGQDISGWGLDLYGKRALVDLLKEISRQANIPWIRLLYLYPDRSLDQVFDLIRDTPNICKYIDLPLQHINSRILKAMNRGVARDEISRLVDKIRKDIPQAAIRTSLIVGFPSESDEEFKELCDFVEEVKFDRLGVFIYSREENTPSFSLSGQLPQKLKSERFNHLMSLQQKISAGVNQKFLGKVIQVLIEEEELARGKKVVGKHVYLGRSEFDAPEVDGNVFVNSSRKLVPGDFVNVEITDTLEYDLVGNMLS